MDEVEFQALKIKYPEHYAKLQTQVDSGLISASELRNRLYRIDHGRKHYQQNHEKLLAHVNEYNAAHREERRAYTRQYDDTHREQRKEYTRQRYLEHRDEILARCRKWFEEHKEEKRFYDQLHYAANREKIQTYHRQYFRDHPELNRVYRENRRARELDRVDQFTPVEWFDKIEEHDRRCIYCGIQDVETPEGALVADHAIPLAKGGSGSIANIVPACKSCNDAKHTMNSEEFFDSIESGHQEDVLVRRYISEHPEIIDKLLAGEDS